MPGKSPRQKGDRFERLCVNDLLAAGIAAHRIPLSGSVGGEYIGDLKVLVQGEDWRIECKSRARDWKNLYGWLEGNKALFLKRDRSDALVVIRLSDFARLAGIAPEKQEAAE